MTPSTSTPIQIGWLNAFRETFARCGLKPGDVVAILAETRSRAVNVELARLALDQLGCRWSRGRVPPPARRAPVPGRSPGAGAALRETPAAIAALAAATMVVDLTVEGLMHARELPAILNGGARVLYVSNEHPDALERARPDESLEARVKTAMKAMRGARTMLVRSPAGTDLRISLAGARVGGVWGWTDKPGTLQHWPGGLVLAFPAAGSVNGTLVIAPGDVNLTFKRYAESQVRLTIADDFVTHIDGHGVDAELMRSYWSAWGDRNAYAVSHVGFGLNHAARWDAMAFYDREDFNGTELRAFAGNFLYSTGANEVARRFTLGHFDLPFCRCTVALDDTTVVKDGVLQEPFA